MTNTESWDRIATGKTPGRPTDIVSYGPDGPTEDELRLLGSVDGKRIVDLGCGAGHAAVALARKGATVIAIDASARMLDQARSLAERAETRIEWHHGDLAELAFLRAESIDIAFSTYALGEVEDLNRLLRQAHRVLRNRGAFVFSYEHPIGLCANREPPDTPSTPIRTVVLHSYFTEEPLTVERDGEDIKVYVRSVTSVFHALTRTGFRVEVIAEPLPTPDALLPRTIVWRARKEGI